MPNTQPVPVPKIFKNRIFRDFDRVFRDFDRVFRDFAWVLRVLTKFPVWVLQSSRFRKGRRVLKFTAPGGG